MTVEEKIGQLFVPLGFSGKEDYLEREILSRHVGGMMYRKGDPKQTQSVFRYLQEHSKIPMLLAANLESGGDGIASTGTCFGKQMQVAATADPEQAYRLGKIACREGKL